MRALAERVHMGDEYASKPLNFSTWRCFSFANESSRGKGCPRFMANRFPELRSPDIISSSFGLKTRSTSQWDVDNKLKHLSLLCKCSLCSRTHELKTQRYACFQ